MQRTPPPPARIHTPPAPLHGARLDTWEAHSPRRSTRISRVPAQHQDTLSARKPRSARHTTPTGSTAPPTTQRDLTPSSTISSDLPPSPRSSRRNHLFDDIPAMLPTPAKTPRKRPQHTDESLHPSARRLFHARHAKPEDAMPTPSKIRKSSMNPFSSGFATKVHDKIPIYTDSKDRIPTASDSDNPFITKGKGKAKANGHDKIPIFTDSKERVPTASEMDNPFMTRSAKGKARAKSPARQPKVPETKSKEEMEAMHRDEGDLFMFRGKKVFLKPDAEPSEALRQAGVAHHYTRSSLKPRILFKDEIQQRKKQQGEPEVAEEETNTEVVVATSSHTEVVVATSSRSEVREVSEWSTHPQPQELTPPATVRAPRLRSFDSWTRTKSSSDRETDSSRELRKSKRSGDLLESPTKRPKGGPSSLATE